MLYNLMKNGEYVVNDGQMLLCMFIYYSWQHNSTFVLPKSSSIFSKKKKKYNRKSFHSI